MVNPLGHWICIPFGNKLQIPLTVLSYSQVIGFRIPLRGFSGFQVTPGLAVLAIQLFGKLIACKNG